MSDIYLSSVDGNDADNGSTWALAKATLAAALTAAGAGGRVFMDNAHAETQASNMSLTSPGTLASPVQVLCVDRTGNPEPPTALATTGSVSTTGANAMTFQGVAYVYGVTFSAGTGISGVDPLNWGTGNSNPGAIWTYENCTIKDQITSTSFTEWYVGSVFGSAADRTAITFINTNLSMGATGGSHSINARGVVRWFGGTLSAAPQTLFKMAGNNLGAAHQVRVRGVDLSQAGSGKNLVDMSGIRCDVAFENCKLGGSVSIATGTIASESNQVEVVNCDSADSNYRYYKKTYQGEILQESTIVRTGGASDGTTPISRKMVSSADSEFYSPLVLDSIRLWNESTGASKTLTVEVITDGVTLTDAEAWLEVEYLGTSGFPLSLVARDRATNILTAPANQASSTATWTTTGLSSPVKQALSVSLTPQEKGVIIARVILAKPSTTMYVCPKPALA